MGDSRGLPQGLLPSDTLATTYLAGLDRAMIRSGLQYARHGDDVRIAADSYEHGYWAARRVEAELRRCGLLLNPSKTRVFRRETYEETLLAHQREWDKTKNAFIEETVSGTQEDESALGDVLQRFELEETGWALFYHGLIDVDEAIDRLRTKMTAEDAEVAEMLFASIVEMRPREGNGRASRLEREVFHWRLKDVLCALAAVESDGALGHVGDLIREYPDKTKIMCKYVMKLRGMEDRIAEEIESAVGQYTMGWGLAWMLQVLGRVSGYLSKDGVKHLADVVDNPRGEWLSGVEAAKCLALRGDLRRESLLVLWDTCPEVFRVDLVVAAVRMEEFADWAKTFVESTRGDRVMEVVIEHEKQRLVSQV